MTNRAKPASRGQMVHARSSALKNHRAEHNGNRRSNRIIESTDFSRDWIHLLIKRSDSRDSGNRLSLAYTGIFPVTVGSWDSLWLRRRFGVRLLRKCARHLMVDVGRYTFAKQGSSYWSFELLF